MTLVSEHIEHDTRERILVVAERLFREIGYQKTTVADIAKVLRMSPANVYRFFDSKKAINEGVARRLMGGVEDAAQAIATRHDSAVSRLRELVTTVHRMNSERYVGDSKLHEMVEIAMEESWEVCIPHMQRITETIASVIADGVVVHLGDDRAADGCAQCDRRQRGCGKQGRMLPGAGRAGPRRGRDREKSCLGVSPRPGLRA